MAGVTGLRELFKSLQMAPCRVILLAVLSLSHGSRATALEGGVAQVMQFMGRELAAAADGGDVTSVAPACGEEIDACLADVDCADCLNNTAKPKEKDVIDTCRAILRYIQTVSPSALTVHQAQLRLYRLVKHRAVIPLILRA